MLQSKIYQVKICLYHCNIVRSPPINFDEDMYFISPNIYQFLSNINIREKDDV